MVAGGRKGDQVIHILEGGPTEGNDGRLASSGDALD